MCSFWLVFHWRSINFLSSSLQVYIWKVGLKVGTMCFLHGPPDQCCSLCFFSKWNMDLWSVLEKLYSFGLCFYRSLACCFLVCAVPRPNCTCTTSVWLCLPCVMIHGNCPFFKKTKSKKIFIACRVSCRADQIYGPPCRSDLQVDGLCCILSSRSNIWASCRLDQMSLIQPSSVWFGPKIYRVMDS